MRYFLLLPLLNCQNLRKEKEKLALLKQKGKKEGQTGVQPFFSEQSKSSK